MGGGDLNLKKSWHPTTMRNMERVWKAEQKHEAEQKKIEELQKELAEERAREEIRHFAEEQGVLKKKSDRLDWMYEGPSALANREEYLLGRPVDKTFEMIQQLEAGTSNMQEDDTLPASILKPSTGNVTVDLANKIREDPLLIIRKQEEDNKRKLLDNPIRMKQLQQMLREAGTKTKSKKSKKTKKKRSKKHHRSDSEESSSEDSGNRHSIIRHYIRQEHQIRHKRSEFQQIYSHHDIDSKRKMKSRHRSPSVNSEEMSGEQKRHDSDSDSGSEKRVRPRRNSFHDESRRNYINSGPKRNERHMEQQDYRGRQRYTDFNYKRRRNISDEKEEIRTGHPAAQNDRGRHHGFDASSKDRRSYNHSRDISSDSEEKEKRAKDRAYDHSRHKRTSNYPSSRSGEKRQRRSSSSSSSEHRQNRKHKTERESKSSNLTTNDKTTSRKLDDAERERRLQEMTQNAKWREEQRKSKFNHYKEEEEKESLIQMQHAGTDFVTPMLNKVADTGSVAGRIKSNIYNIQRTKADLNANFAKR